MTARASTSAPPRAVAVLEAAVDELDAITGEGIAGVVDAGDLDVPLNAVAGLIVERRP